MNIAIIVGTLVDEAVVRKTKTGSIVVDFTLAVSESPDSPTEYIKCTQFRKTPWPYDLNAQILVEGRLETSSYETKEGKKRSTTRVISNKVRRVG